MLENGWVLLALGVAGAAAFFSFIWMLTAPFRKSVAQRDAEREEIRQAALRQARGGAGVGDEPVDQTPTPGV